MFHSTLHRGINFYETCSKHMNRCEQLCFSLWKNIYLVYYPAQKNNQKNCMWFLNRGTTALVLVLSTVDKWNPFFSSEKYFYLHYPSLFCVNAFIPGVISNIPNQINILDKKCLIIAVFCVFCLFCRPFEKNRGACIRLWYSFFFFFCLSCKFSYHK